VGDPLARRVARERLLHQHRPRIQRRDTLGEHAAYVVLTPQRDRWRAAASRTVPASRRGPLHVLGPLPSRDTARAAAGALCRLAAAGAALGDVVDSLSQGRIPDRPAGNAGGTGAGPGAPDAVDTAIDRLDQAALLALAHAHTEVRDARRLGLFTGLRAPVPPRRLPPPDEPLPLELLSELLVLARWSGDRAEAHGHAVQAEHEVAPPPGQLVVGGQLEIVEPAQQFLEQHA
jgi:hypothetical protein